MWYPHMNRNWFGVICKELLCPVHKLEPFTGDAYKSRPDFKFSNI